MYDINLEFFFCNYSCPSCVIKYLIKKLFHSIISRSSFQNENLLRFWTKERNNSVWLYSTFQKWKTKKISNFFLSKIEKKKRIKRSSFIAEKLFTSAVEDGYNIWRMLHAPDSLDTRGPHVSIPPPTSLPVGVQAIAPNRHACEWASRIIRGRMSNVSPVLYAKRRPAR